MPTRASSFCCDAGAIVPVALTGGTSGGSGTIRNPPDMNDNGDVVYERGSTSVYLWDHATLGTIPIAGAGDFSPGGGMFSHFGERPVVNDAQRVAFEAEVSGGPEGIFASGPFAPIVACALEDAPSPIAGGTYNTFAPTGEVSINAAGKVAFTANVAIPGPDTSGCLRVRYRRDRALFTVAQEGDLVSGTPRRASTTSSSASTTPSTSPSRESPPVG